MLTKQKEFNKIDIIFKEILLCFKEIEGLYKSLVDREENCRIKIISISDSCTINI